MKNEELDIVHAVGRKIIADEEFDSLLTDAVKREKELANNNNYKQITSKLIIFLRKKPSEPLTLLPIFMTDFPYENRDKIFLGLGVKVFEKAHEEHLAPVAIFWISEAWSSKFSPEVEKRIQEGEHIEDFDDKEEIFIINGMTLDRRMNNALTKISRLGEFVHLGETRFAYVKDEEKNKAIIDIHFISSFFLGWKMAAEGEIKKKGGLYK